MLGDDTGEGRVVEANVPSVEAGEGRVVGADVPSVEAGDC